LPLYEYQCKACDRRLEVLQRLAEPPLTTCPECGGELRKLVSAPAFQFKGEGWYVTDYARKQESGGAQAADRAGEKAEKAAREGKPEAKAEGKTGGKAEGKTESKEAAKKETKKEGKAASRADSPAS
jgi:putative FmdB family regulatory protein